MIFLYQSYEQHFLSFIACIDSALQRHDFSEGQVSFKDFTHWLGQLKVGACYRIRSISEYFLSDFHMFIFLSFANISSLKS